MKAPAYQWYPKDALSDERYRLLTYEQRGVYRELLDSQWMEGSIPADPPTLARLLGIDEKPWLSIWLSVCVFFVETPELPGRLLNLTLDAQRRKKAAYSSSMRDNGKRGGRPRLDSKQEKKKPEKSRSFISAKPTESSANCKLQIANCKETPIIPFLVLEHLNTCLEKAGLRMRYRADAKGNQAHVTSRIAEGYTESDLTLVVEHKIALWGDDTEKAQYLRPETLFGHPTKIESYVQAARDWDARGRPPKGATNGKRKDVRNETLSQGYKRLGAEFAAIGIYPEGATHSEPTGKQSA